MKPRDTNYINSRQNNGNNLVNGVYGAPYVKNDMDEDIVIDLSQNNEYPYNHRHRGYDLEEIKIPDFLYAAPENMPHIRREREMLEKKNSKKRKGREKVVCIFEDIIHWLRRDS